MWNTGLLIFISVKLNIQAAKANVGYSDPTDATECLLLLTD